LRVLGRALHPYGKNLGVVARKPSRDGLLIADEHSVTATALQVGAMIAPSDPLLITTHPLPLGQGIVVYCTDLRSTVCERHSHLLDAARKDF
jgi:hypothetical protein